MADAETRPLTYDDLGAWAAAMIEHERHGRIAAEAERDELKREVGRLKAVMESDLRALRDYREQLNEHQLRAELEAVKAQLAHESVCPVCNSNYIKFKNDLRIENANL